MPARVSLLMPTYNRAKYVAESIRSILEQTYHDFELVVWDDGSTDKTVAVARKVVGGDPRVRIIEAEHHGQTKSINAAAAMLSGAYLGWVDSDDKLAPTALEKTAAVLDAEPSVGMVYTSYLVIDVLGQVRGRGNRCKIPYSRDRLLVDFMTFHFRLMRKPLFHQIGGVEETMRAAQDYDMCLKLSEIAEIRHLDEPLYYYRVHLATTSQVDRVQQIYDTRDAIQAALKRRKLDDELELKLQIVSKFSLVQKGQRRSRAGEEQV